MAFKREPPPQEMSIGCKAMQASRSVTAKKERRLTSSYRRWRRQVRCKKGAATWRDCPPCWTRSARRGYPHSLPPAELRWDCAW